MAPRTHDAVTMLQTAPGSVCGKRRRPKRRERVQPRMPKQSRPWGGGGCDGGSETTGGSRVTVVVRTTPSRVKVSVTVRGGPRRRRVETVV